MAIEETSSKNSLSISNSETVMKQDLIYATEHSDCETLQKILESHEFTDINAQDDKGNSALTIAVNIGDKDKMALLLKYGADIEITKEKLSKKDFSKLRRLYRQVQDTIPKPPVKADDHKPQTFGKKTQNIGTKMYKDVNKIFRKAIMEKNIKKVSSLLENTPVDVNAEIKYTNKPDIAEFIALIWAAEHGDEQIVNLLLKHPHIDINIKDSQGFTALMCAAENGRTKVLDLLLKQPNIKVNLQNNKGATNKGATALMLAVNNNHEVAVMQLLSHSDIDIDIKTVHGGTALLYAELNKNKKIIDLLLNHKGRPKVGINELKYSVSEELSKIIALSKENKNLPNWKIKNANEELLNAVRIGNIKEIRSTLDNSPADINARGPLGESALMLASFQGNNEAVKLLLQHSNVDVNLGDNRGITALMVASRAGHETIVKMLLNHGADVLIQDRPQHFTALMIAAQYGHNKVVEMLLNHGAKVNVQASKGQTALMLAEYFGTQENGYITNQYLEIVKTLLNHGANVNIRNQSGDTAFMLAVSLENEALVRLLLNHGVDTDNKNDALMIAVSRGYDKMVKVLLEDRSIDVNRDDPFGVTLIRAIRNGYPGIVNQLLKHGADINAKDSYGMSALAYAIEGGDSRIIQALLKHKQRIIFDTASNEKETLVAKAKETDREKIVRLVRSELMPESQQVGEFPAIPKKKTESTQEEIKPVQTKNSYERFKEAVSQGDSNEIDLLLEEKDTKGETIIDINEKNGSGDTALIVATRKGHLNVMRSLLEGRADISIKDVNGDNALLIAADNGNLEAVNLLLSYEADISSKDANGDNALIRAAKNGHLGVVNGLTFRKLSLVNSTGQDRRTALMAAAENGHIAVVRLLIKKGSKVSAKDKYNQTAYNIVNEKINVFSKSQDQKDSEKKIYLSIRNLLKSKENNEASDPLEHLSMKNFWPVNIDKCKKELKNWEKNAPDIYEKIKILIHDIKMDPFSGRGRPECLKGNLKGLYSRKITKKDRLVYEVDGEKVIFQSCKGHYDKEKL